MAKKAVKMAPALKVAGSTTGSPRKVSREVVAPEKLALVQIVARELADGRVRGSLTRLSRLSAISLESLRVLKRDQGSSASRKLAPPRVRLLAVLVAAQRLKMLDRIVIEAADVEQEWRKQFPNDFSS